MSAEQKTSLIFIPFPILSHLVPTVETAKLIADRDERISIKVLIIKMPFDTKIDTYINANHHHPRIDFVHLPENESVSAELLKSQAVLSFPFIESQKGFVKDAVSEILTDEGSKCAGFVIDMVCFTMMDVAADEFMVPSYIIYTAGLATLGLLFHLQALHDDHNHDLSMYEDSSSSEAVISAPMYVNPFPAKLLPDHVLTRTTSRILDIMRRVRNAKGIIVNSFLELEPHPLNSLFLDEKIPSIYPVGPVIVRQEISDDDEIIGWLNEQPDSSVVFLCFGSNWCLEEDQVKEIAAGLESGGYRFLWAVRKPHKDKLDYPGEYEDPQEVLPEGFLERTAGIGRVIGWAHQTAILSHRAVGGFVSHCGWNSIMESVSCGVSIATWPLAFEQQANAFQLVEEIGVGVEVKMDNRKIHGTIVGADVIERAIRRLMDTGSQARVTANVLKERGRIALMKGGSSYKFLGDLLADIMD